MTTTGEVSLAAVIDAATQVAIVATDLSGVITHFNSGAEQMLGYRRSEVVGRQSPVIFHLESEIREHGTRLRAEFGDLPEEFPVFVERARRGHYEEREWTYVRKDGSRLTVSLVVTAVRDARSVIVGYVGVARDVSDRIKTEAALRRGEALKSAILEAALDAVLTIDHQGSILEFNPAAERILGFPRWQAIGRRLSDLIIPERFREAHERGLAKYLETGEGPVLGRRIEIFALRADGVEIPVELEIAVVPQESPPVFSAYIRDISDRKRAEEQLRDREARLRSIVETAVDAIIVIDERGIIESYNPGAEQIFGYSAAEASGQNVTLLMNPPDALEHGARIRRFMTTGVTQIIGTPRDVYARRKDGTEICIELSVSEMRIGEARKFTGIARDVTLRNRNRTALAATNSLLESIRQAQSQFIAKDRDSNVFEALLASALKLTDSAHGFLGEALFDDQGRPYLRMRAISNVAWDDATRKLYQDSKGQGLEFHNLENLFGRVLATAKPLISNCPANDERRGGLPSGHQPLDSFLGVPICLGKNLVGIVGLANRPGGYFEEMVDYLEPFLRTCATIIQGDRGEHARQRAERELQEAKQVAESANRAKSEFLANMSHEVRTPMAAVLGFSEMLLNHGLSQSERDKAIQSIRLNGQHLMQIIDDILDLTKIEAQKLVLEYMPYSPWQIVQEVLSLLRVRASERSIALSVRAEGVVPKLAMVDPTRVRQILVNFVSNALKFTPAGGQVRVRFWCFNEDPQAEPLVCMSVEDTGIGIAREQLERLFEPFQQADTSTTRRFGGTGLGLSISMRLAEAMGGEITVTSEEGRGSEFTLRIPVGISRRQMGWVDAAELESAWVSPRLPSDTTVPTRMNGRILLAEDNPDIQTVVVAHLESAGLEVEVASNGQEAVCLAQSGKFDVILMDMQMPKLDGYGATSSLRQSGYRGPILALTAHAFAEDRARCLKVGCTEHLSKPITRELLLETISRYLAKREQTHPASTAPPKNSSSDSPPETPVSRERGAADNGLNQLQRGFVSRLPERVREIEQALAESDLTKLKSLAHRTKGVGGMYGFPELSEAGGALELAVREEQPRESLAQLVQRYSAVCADIVKRTAAAANN